MRWLGALLMVAACGGTGVVWTAAVRRKLGILQDLCHLLGRMQTELCQRATPLPDLMEQLGQGELAAELRRGIPVSVAAKPRLDRLEKSRDLPQAAQTLTRLAQVLGRYDSATQAAACGAAAAELEEQRAALARELQEKGKLYRTVPLALGMMAALVVL